MKPASGFIVVLGVSHRRGDDETDGWRCSTFCAWSPFDPGRRDEHAFQDEMYADSGFIVVQGGKAPPVRGRRVESAPRSLASRSPAATRTVHLFLPHLLLPAAGAENTEIAYHRLRYKEANTMQPFLRAQTLSRGQSMHAHVPHA